MSPYLLDSNVLIALTTADHVHHDAVWRWFGRLEPDVATCPITEGALIRYQLRVGSTHSEASGRLDVLRQNPWHRFWPDDLAYSDAMLTGVLGYRQVTDAYLAALAEGHGGTLATLDRGLAAIHPSAALIED